MPPMYGQPNYNFIESSEEVYTEIEDYRSEDDSDNSNLTHMAFWYMIVLVAMLLCWLVVFFCLRIIALGQKTRNQQQRRVYVGERGRASSAGEPTIFVSPANLPPPPKYDALAPPSYEEVMGVNFQTPQVQPITYPLTHAIAQSSNQRAERNQSEAITQNEVAPQSTVITVTADERRTSVTVATS